MLRRLWVVGFSLDQQNIYGPLETRDRKQRRARIQSVVRGIAKKLRRLVRMRGLEPPQDCSHSVLSAARLPFRHIRIRRFVIQQKQKYTNDRSQSVSIHFVSAIVAAFWPTMPPDDPD